MTEPLNRRRFSLALVSMAVASPALALRYEDQDFDDTLALGGSTLVLNGVGEKAGKLFRAYTAALYLGSKASTIDTVTAMTGPKPHPAGGQQEHSDRPQQCGR